MKRFLIAVSYIGVIAGFAWWCVVSLGGQVWVNGTLYRSISEAKAGVLSSYDSMFEQEELNEFVSCTVDLSELENRSRFEGFMDWIQNKNYDVVVSRTVDVAGITSYITDLNEAGIAPKDAYIDENDDGFYIVPEVDGSKIYIDRFIRDIGDKKLDLSDYIIETSVKSSDLEEICESLNNYKNWSVVYDNGIMINTSAESITYDKDNGISLDYTFLDEALNNIVDEYNTVGIERNFITSSGENIKVSGGTWGSIVDKEKELDFLTKNFENCVSIKNRRPEYEYERELFGDNYIEVSIADQHMWLYKSGVLIMESDVVTGTKSRHDTPTGAYFISERKSGKYLTGDTYRTWVNKWLRITNRGHGFHDATWRNKFGGRIYEYSGSHGCINLPYKFACELYEQVEWGTPVIIY